MKKVIICTNHRADPAQPSCAGRNSLDIAHLLEQGIAEKGITVAVEHFQCLGQCDIGPNLKMSPNGNFCNGVQPDDVPVLLEKIRAFANTPCEALP